MSANKMAYFLDNVLLGDSKAAATTVERPYKKTATATNTSPHHHHHNHRHHFHHHVPTHTSTAAKILAPAERLRENLGLRLHTAAEKLRLSRFLRKCVPAVLRGESYIPCTKLSFLADRAPGSLICALCQDSHLVVMDVDYGRGSRGEARQRAARDRDPDADDSVPAFLPCGHVAGAECMRLWLGEHDTCPFCRVGLRYRECGHSIPPRQAADAREVHMLPATVPEGGAVPETCVDCFQLGLEEAFSAKWAKAMREFRHEEARARRLEQNGVDAHWVRVQEKKDVLDNLYSVEVMEPLGRRWAQRSW